MFIFQTLRQELTGFVYWAQEHNAIASQKLQPILCPHGKGGLEHQFVQPHHTRETGPFCNSCHVAQSTKQVYNQDLPQNLCGTASKDMGLNEQSFPTRGHPKNINNQRKKTTAELYTLFVLGANSLHHLPCARSQSHQVTLHHTYRMVVDAGGGWN